MNTGNLIVLTMLNYWFGGGGVSEVGGEEGDGSGGVNGYDNYGMCCLIKLNTLLGETQACSSSLTSGGEIKGLFIDLSALCRSTH